MKIWQLLTIDFAEKVHAWQAVYLSLERRTLGQLVAEAFDKTKLQDAALVGASWELGEGKAVSTRIRSRFLKRIRTRITTRIQP